MIGAHSEYFRTALKANTFRVRNDCGTKCSYVCFADQTQEGQTGTIELKAVDSHSDDPEDACDDPEIVKLMVRYFYHLDYLHDDNENEAAEEAVIEISDSPAPPKKKAKKSAPAKKTQASKPAPTQAAPPSAPKVHLLEHAKVFAMAVKYHVDALRDLAAQKFKAEVEEHWDHEHLANAIYVIYTSTAEEVTQIREVAVEALNQHRLKLLAKPEIATLLRSMTGLACDLLMRDHSSATGHGDLYAIDGIGNVACYDIERHRGNMRSSDFKCDHCAQRFKTCVDCYFGDPTYFVNGRRGY